METLSKAGLVTKEQLKVMLDLQSEVNSLIDADWQKKRFPFLRAVLVEGVEGMDHHGWKWWKSQTKDLGQLQMELVDIWHFLLSEQLIRHGDSQSAASAILNDLDSGNEVAFDGIIFNLEKMDTIELFELLIGMSAVRKMNLSVFNALLVACEMTWDAVLKQYLGKNVLNIFRQQNGYKEGTYVKIWGKKEDNEVLVDILRMVDMTQANVKDKILLLLKKAYVMAW